jgi:hypothetical protein
MSYLATVLLILMLAVPGMSVQFVSLTGAARLRTTTGAGSLTGYNPWWRHPPPTTVPYPYYGGYYGSGYSYGYRPGSGNGY